MAKRVDFTVSKNTAGLREGDGVFTTLSVGDHIVRVMDAGSYARAAKRADKALASVDLTHRRAAQK